MSEPPRVHSVPVRGGRMEVLTLPGGAGTPLLVLGGVETALRPMAGTESVLAHRWRRRRSTRTVVVVGRPLAARPDRVAELAHPRAIADAVADPLEGLGRPVAVEAESGGGRVALWLAAEHPELVDRMVLASVAAETPPSMAAALGRWIELAQDQRWGELYAHLAVIVRPAGSVQAAALSIAARATPAPATPERFVEELRATLDPSSYVTDRLSAIRGPALVLAGGQDRVVPPDATRAVADGIPDARFEIDPECGHTVRGSFTGYDALVDAFLSSSIG
ncbi:MAG: alpha/beta fold hydrolase [Candidatus Limnocylindria bacterium]